MDCDHINGDNRKVISRINRPGNRPYLAILTLSENLKFNFFKFGGKVLGEVTNRFSCL